MRLGAFISTILLFCSLFVSTAEIQIQSSLPGTFPDAFQLGPRITATVTSTFELQSVTADYGTQHMVLALSANNVFRAPAPFDISSAPSGPNNIEVTARDVFGTNVQTNVTFQVDRLPIIKLLQPLHGALARPLIHAELTATDDLDTPTIALSINGVTTILTNATYASRTIDLSPFEGSLVSLHYRVGDHLRFTGDTLISVLSLSNPRYQDLVRVPGWIFDANNSAVLYTNQSNDLIKYDIATRSEMILATNVLVGNSVQGQNGYSFEPAASLTPTGAIYWEGPTAGRKVREVRNGTAIDHQQGTFRTPVVRGNHAFIATDRTFLRDFSSDVNYPITSLLLTFVLADEGSLVYQVADVGAGNPIYKLKNGVTTPIPEEPGRVVYNSDGTNILYFTRISSQAHAIHLRTPEGLVLLTDSYSHPADLFDSVRTFSLMNGGWTAFPRLGAQQQQQIWLRSPQGTISQATFYSRSSLLRALSPNGSLLTSIELTPNQPVVVFTPRGGAPQELGPDFGGPFATRYFFVGEDLYAFWGGTLFRLITSSAEQISFASPKYDFTTDSLSYYVTASSPATFVLQRSTNFADWIDLSTNSVSNTLPTKFLTTTSPGFFRLRTEP